MVRWTMTAAATIVVLLACGQPENLEDRLIEAEKRLAMAEDRIAAYERESATPTPLPTATATPAPTATPTLLSGAGPTPTALYGGLSTETPMPTATPDPTSAPTATPLAGTGLTIRERYEELARVELVARTEERRTLSGCNDPARCNVSDWRYEDVTVFTVPKGLGAWVIRFTDVPGPRGYPSTPEEGDLYVYHPSNPGSTLGYIHAHNIWVHIMQLYSGRLGQWPR